MACINEGDTKHAPRYTIPPRRLGALEHPLIIEDVDRGIRTFGSNPALQAILDSASPQISVPLYLRPDNPTVRPLTSHNALTHNVVLKLTVPKRTGRKRKRGTNDPFEGVIEQSSPSTHGHQVLSRERLDGPKALRRKLRDNVDKYQVEPVGVIHNTHRYRGLADFQYSLGNSKFMSRFVEKVLPGDVQKLKDFALEPGIEAGHNIDLVPPPNFTPMTLPFAYSYSQNPYTKEVSPGPSSPSGSISEDQEYTRVVNVTSRVPAAGYFIAHDEYPVPSGPSREPDMSDPQVALIMTEMRLAMEERPIWTRRSMWNRLGSKFASLPKSGSLVRHCLQYAGYQFKGGPWRDALVKYGLDPRSDPKYRIYQTLIFKLHKTRIGSVGRSWQAVRRNELGVTNFGRYWREMGDEKAPLDTHIFNGEAFSTDGKVWQVCDITDPLLAKLFAGAEVRTDCDVEISGYYHRVLWSVAKAIMKCKMLAIRFGRTLTDEDFSATLDAVKGPNDGGDGGSGTSIGISLPDLQLTQEECELLRGRKMKPGLRQSRDRWEEKRKRTHYRVRIPVKESEAREADKMIRLLSMTMGATATGSNEPDEAANAAEAQRQMTNENAGAGIEQDLESGEQPSDIRAAEADVDIEEGEDQEEGGFQELLDDLDEEDDSDEDESEDDELDEEDEEEDEGMDDEDEDMDDEGDSDHGVANTPVKKSVTFEINDEHEYYDGEGYDNEQDDEDMGEDYEGDSLEYDEYGDPVDYNGDEEHDSSGLVDGPSL
ncbi:RNA polymerase III transcription factor IIIC subunit-domain-containing protein [Cercophora newfieldiana]|uniref:RNA polymerase III transcription factor IIIC subunit-domain-containing protein n=1 Tax=Cercophora newfieldiana TaxID=92897 RepID=A0AA39YFS4_9PEZI|nr:RNA polymerase III transcription factor IIIC subunit-domain-containing protein [Cercophora newfieldiana]